MKKIALVSLAAAMSLAASDLTTHAELGYVETKGNTDTKTFTFDGNVKKDIQKHSLKLSLDAQYGENDGVENKNKYKVIGEYFYAYSKEWSFGYMAGYKDDKFSGFEYQFTTGPVVKWTPIDTKEQKLAFDLGVLYAVDKPDNADSNDYASGAAALEYTYQVLENLKFSENASYRTDLSDTDTYFVFSKTALTSKLSDVFSAGISYKVDYTNIPPFGAEHTDRTLAINLIADF